MNAARFSEREGVQKLVEIESWLPISSFEVDGTNLWPYFRSRIWRHLTKRDAQRCVPKSKTSTPAAAAFAGLARDALAHATARSRARSFAANLNSHPRVVLCDLAPTQYVTLRQGPYAIRLDPFVDLLRKRGAEVVKLLGNNATATVVDSPSFEIPTKLIERLSGWRRLGSSVFDRKRKSAIRKMCDLVNDSVIGLNVHTNEVLSWLGIRGAFTQFLQSVRPDVVIVTCYYNKWNMEIIRASRALGIRTVDVQHGKQGVYQGMYNHWTRIPDRGFSYLPDVFWCWGEDSRQNIELNSQTNLRHRAIVGGDPWLRAWLRNDIELDLDRRSKEFLESLDGYNRVVLYSLQHDGAIPVFVRDCIANSPDSWFWGFRLHPLVSSASASDVRLRLPVQRNVSIDEVSRIPLLPLLQHASHHVTAWSSVCYEALAVGRPSIITSTQGLELYDDYIGKSHFGYADSCEQLRELIGQGENWWNPVELTPYINTDAAIIEAAVDDILRR